MKNKTMGEEEKIFFTNAVTERNNSDIKKQNFLLFFITLNIAFLGGILQFEKGSILCIDSKEFIYWTQLIINILFYIIYIREHRLSTIRDEILENMFRSKLIKKYLKDVKFKDYFNRRLTWICIKIVFSLFVLIPLLGVCKINLNDQSVCIGAIILLFFILLFFEIFYEIFAIIISILTNIFLFKTHFPQIRK